MTATVAGVHLGLDTHANRPAANTAPDGSLYSCSTHKLIYKSNYAGNSWATWGTLPADTGSMATDSFWTAAGQLALATGSGAASPLAIGAAGKFLSSNGTTASWGQGPLTTTGDLMAGATGGTPTRLALGGAGSRVGSLNGVLAYDSGTSNPTGAAGDRYWRRDLNLGIAYDGTRWVADRQYFIPLGIVGGTLPIAATAANFMRAPMPYSGIYSFLVERVVTSFYVVGGTALSGSHKWVGNIADEAGSFYTVTIASGASDTWRRDDSGALTTVEASHFDLEATWTKTGTPGTLYMVVGIYGRPIIT